MPTITIPARQIQPDDVICIGGDMRTVIEVRSSLTAEGLPCRNIRVDNPECEIRFPQDATIIVSRPNPPDPDAPIVEAIAKAVHARRDHSVFDRPWGELSTTTTRDHNLRKARMYLNAYREVTKEQERP